MIIVNMSFITLPDFKPLIKDDTLERIIENDTTILTEVILSATEEVISYLSGTYDTDIIFAQTGANRNPLIKQRTIDITLYHLYSRLKPTAIPAMRKERYEEAIIWLDKVSAGKYNPNLPRKIDAEGETVTNLKWGSDDRQDFTG